MAGPLPGGSPARAQTHRGGACVCSARSEQERKARGGTQSWPRGVAGREARAQASAARSREIVVEDASAQASMKSAASCETSCDTQDLVNHRILERPTPAAGGNPALWAPLTQRRQGADTVQGRQPSAGRLPPVGGLCLLGPGGCARRPRSRSRAGPASTRPPSLPLSPGGGGGGRSWALRPRRSLASRARLGGDGGSQARGGCAARVVLGSRAAVLAGRSVGRPGWAGARNGGDAASALCAEMHSTKEGGVPGACGEGALSFGWRGRRCLAGGVGLRWRLGWVGAGERGGACVCVLAAWARGARGVQRCVTPRVAPTRCYCTARRPQHPSPAWRRSPLFCPRAGSPGAGPARAEAAL